MFKLEVLTNRRYSMSKKDGAKKTYVGTFNMLRNNSNDNNNNILC